MADAPGQTSRQDAFVSRLWAFIVALLIGILGLVVGIILGGIVIVLLRLAGVELGAFVLLVISLITLQGIAFGGVALSYLRYRGVGIEYIGFDIGFPSLRSSIAVVAGLILAFIGVVVGSQLIAIIDMVLTGTEIQPAQNAVVKIARGNPAVLLLLIPAAYLLIGPGEELLFRGVIQGRIREAFGPAAGILLASAIFAAIHFTALGGSTVGQLATIAVLFLPSLVFGTAYELTDNLVVPILIHATYDAIQFVILYVALTRGLMPAVI